MRLESTYSSKIQDLLRLLTKKMTSNHSHVNMSSLDKWILVSNYYPMMNLYSLPMGMLNQLMAQFIYQMMVKSMLINTRKLCLNRYNNITSHDIITKRFNRLIEEMATTLCVLTKCHLLKHIK